MTSVDLPSKNVRLCVSCGAWWSTGNPFARRHQCAGGPALVTVRRDDDGTRRYVVKCPDYTTAPMTWYDARRSRTAAAARTATSSEPSDAGETGG
jgi:hypothetical protein